MDSDMIVLRPVDHLLLPMLPPVISNADSWDEMIRDNYEFNNKTE